MRFCQDIGIFVFLILKKIVFLGKYISKDEQYRR